MLRRDDAAVGFMTLLGGPAFFNVLRGVVSEKVSCMACFVSGELFGKASGLLIDGPILKGIEEDRGNDLVLIAAMECFLVCVGERKEFGLSRGVCRLPA